MDRTAKSAAEHAGCRPARQSEHGSSSSLIPCGETEYVYVSDREREHDNDHRETSEHAREKRVRNGAGCYAGTDDAAERGIG